MGYGGGVALLFFHAKKDEPVEDVKRNLQNGAEDRKPSLPPSISGVMVLQLKTVPGPPAVFISAPGKRITSATPGQWAIPQ